MKTIKCNNEFTVSIKGITCDSREVKPGYAFVAIEGLNNDGHNFIDQAIDNGARYIFTEKPCQSKKNNKKSKIITVKDSKKILGELAAQFYNYPSRKLEVIGVTGTNGKTTTTHLLYNLLNFHHKKAGLIGTVKVDTGNSIHQGDLTTPPPVLLQKYLSKMVQNKLKYACMEVSSHGIKLKRISGTDFAVKVGTNISEDHFDFHNNFENYLNVKKSFLEDEQDALVLINKDNPYLYSLGKLSQNQLYYGINTKAAISIDNIQAEDKYTQFIYKINKKLTINNKKLIPCQIPIKTMLFGKHNIYNCIIAISIALFYNIKAETIKEFFRIYSGVWRRTQLIYDQKYKIIDDCAHNPGSYYAVFDAIKNINFNKLWIVNSLRGNRGLEINKANAATIADCLKNVHDFQLITTNCCDTASENDCVFPEEEKAFLDVLITRKIPFKHFKHLIPALKKVVVNAQKNDLILLLGPHAMDEAGGFIKKIIADKNSFRI